MRRPNIPFQTMLLCVLVADPGRSQVLFEEKFEGEADLEKRGWSIHAETNQSRWEVEDGALKVTCFFKPYSGGNITREVPYTRRGEFTFEANVAGAGSTPGYDHLSLQVALGNVMLSFNGYGDHHLQRYYEEQWREVARPVPQGKWTRFRVRFDADQRIAEYYCGDMEHPTSVETDLEWKPTEGQNTMRLLIGNYGLCTGTLVHRVDNVVLQELPPAPPGAAGPGVTVYRGLSFERLRTAEIIREMKVENPSVFTLLTGLGLGPQNRFFLDRMPPVLTAGRDRLILMVDLPVGPGEALPPFAQQKIRTDVAHGAQLVILGGPVTLGNGCFQGSPLEEILPVELHGPWEIKPAPQPLRLHSPEPSLKEFFGGPEQPSVFFYHQVQPKAAARVLAYADDLPILIEKAYQEGSVIVFAAAPLGQSTEGYPGYWEWSRWPEFIVQAAGLREGI